MNNPTPAAGSDAGLTPVHGDTLSALMNMIVPRSPDGRMPGAGDLPELVHHLAATIPALREHLDMLDRDALARYGAAFGALDEVRRATLLEDLRSRNPQVMDRLALETVTCYYQQDRVLQGLGMEARPPYPKGYRVEPGDLSLLDPVIARGKIYREIP